MLRQAYQAGASFRAIKVFHPEDYAAVKAASPDTEVVYRPYVDDLNQDQWVQAAAAGRAMEAAHDYIDRWIGSVAAYMPAGAVESLNEEYPTGNAAKLAAITTFDEAFIRAMAQRLPGRRAVVFTAAVGNPGWDEQDRLLPLARTAAQYGAIFGYHAYWPVKNGISRVDDPTAWQHLHGRWAFFDNYLRARGWAVRWFLGEVGAIGCYTLDPAPGQNWGLIPEAGWKKSDVWNGDVAAYKADLAKFDRLLARTQAAKDGRLWGSAIFTSNNDPGGQWRYFRVNDSMAWEVADLVSHGVDVEEPPPPPPPPGDGLNAALWAASVQEQVDHGLSLNAAAGLQKAITAAGMTPVHSEITVYHNGQKYVIQAGEDLTGRRARRVYVWQPGRAVWSFTQS